MAAGFDDAQARAALHRAFQAALAAADPLTALPAHLPELPRGRCIVIGVGKAAAKMALAVEREWADQPLSGLVITTHGADVPSPGRAADRGTLRQPSRAGCGRAAAAAEMLGLLRGLSADDLVLFLVSGGGSSLSTLPAPGLSLNDLMAVNRELLRSGHRSRR
jgi:glycerate-2-kinase